MQFDKALAYLLSLGHETLTIKLGLRNTDLLLAALGNPQRSFPAVQIAGTNGKGSTAVMLEAICRAAGIRTGLFTSPHLVSITERIKIDGQEITAEEFGRLTGSVRDAAAELVQRGELKTLPTFFEHVTAIALLAFSEARVELAILETGLGGRLDSTTAAGAQIVGITPIAVDHEEYLGSTIAKIAAEKAAIIRRGVTAVIAPQEPEAFEVIARRCEETGVTPITLARSNGRYHAQLLSVEEGRSRVAFTTPDFRYANVLLNLRGRHQIDNALVTIALAEALRDRGFAISPQSIVRGLESAVHPGRLEWWAGHPSILFDGAHNPAAARALRDYLDEFVPAAITLVFGAMKDKRLQEMADALMPKADRLVLTQLDNPRAASLDQLLTVVPAGYEKDRIATASSVAQALQIAAENTSSDGVICVTGSLYLVGTAQQLRREKFGERW